MKKSVKLTAYDRDYIKDLIRSDVKILASVKMFAKILSQPVNFLKQNRHLFRIKFKQILL